MVDLSSPADVMRLLGEIERDMAIRQNDYEKATRDHFLAIREQKRLEAQAIVSSDKGTVTERKAQGTLAAFDTYTQATEAQYEALDAVMGVLNKRSMILMALLKSMGRI